MRCLALALSFLMVFSGCSTYSYSARPVSVPKIETMPILRTEGPVTIGLDPYIQTDRQKEVFDADLEEVGVLPIYLLVKNNSDRPISLADIALEYPSGYQIFPVKTETVLRMLPRSTTHGLVAGSLLVIGIFIWPLLIPGAGMALAKKKANDAQIADYQNKEFTYVKLNKDDSAQGFVFFMPPSSGLEALKGKIVLRFEDTDVVRVPLSI